jgi:hypothetical protein
LTTIHCSPLTLPASGAILSNGNWVGDNIRVRIRAINPVSSSDETQNWEAIYDVTLQAVDPFWDVAYGVPFATYASLVLFDERTDPPTYVVPHGVTLPIPLRGTVPASRGGNPFTESHARYGIAESKKPKHLNVVHASRDTDVTGLPTIVEHYINKVAESDPAVFQELQRSRSARAEYVRNAPRRAAPMFHHQAALPHAVNHHQLPASRKQHKAPPHRREEPVRRTGQHLKGRRN